MMILAAVWAASGSVAVAQDFQCRTSGSTTQCSDVTPPPAAVQSDPAAKPAITSIGRSGPTRYEQENIVMYGVDDRIRLLGETNYKTGQESPMVNSRRNCGLFHTSIICQD